MRSLMILVALVAISTSNTHAMITGGDDTTGDDAFGDNTDDTLRTTSGVDDRNVHGDSVNELGSFGSSEVQSGELDETSNHPVPSETRDEVSEPGVELDNPSSGTESTKVQDKKHDTVPLGKGFNILTGSILPTPMAIETTTGDSAPQGTNLQFRETRPARLVKNKHHRTLLMQDTAAKDEVVENMRVRVATATFSKWEEESAHDSQELHGRPNAFGSDGPFTMGVAYEGKVNSYAAENFVQVRKVTHYASDQQLSAPKASPELENAVCKDPKFPKCEDWSKCTQKDIRFFSTFVNKFGTHYISGVQMGGQKTTRYELNSRSLSFQDSLVEAGNSLSSFLQNAASSYDAVKAMVDTLGKALTNPQPYENHVGMEKGALPSVAQEYTDAQQKLQKLREKLGIVEVRTTYIGGGHFGENSPDTASGWAKSLGNPNLHGTVQKTVEPLTNLIRTLPCDGEKKAALFQQGVKEVVSLRFQMAEKRYRMAVKNVALEKRRHLVSKMKTDWFHMMRRFSAESMQHAKTALDLQAAAIKFADGDKTAGAQQHVDDPEIPQGATVDAVMLSKWISRADEDTIREIVSTPVFAKQQLNSMAMECASYCSAQRGMSRKSLILGVAPTGGNGAEDSGDVAGVEDSGGDSVLSPGGLTEGGDLTTTPTTGAEMANPTPAPDMMSLSSVAYDMVESQEKQCETTCGDLYSETLDEFTPVAPEIDDRLNFLWSSLTKRVCKTCSRAVLVDAIAASPGLGGAVFTRAAPGDEGGGGDATATYCEPGFSETKLDQAICVSVTSTLAVEIQRSTRYDGEEFFSKESMSSMLLGLGSCISNCAPASYSFANLAADRPPAVWAQQVCGAFFNCPPEMPDEVAVSEVLRTINQETEQDRTAQTELMNALHEPEDKAQTVKPKELVQSPIVQAEQEEFCRDIVIEQASTLALRHDKVMQFEDQSCYVCLATMESDMSGKKEEGGVCEVFTGKDDKLPAAMDQSLILPGNLQQMVTGFGPYENAKWRKTSDNRRRRLLRVHQESRRLAHKNKMTHKNKITHKIHKDKLMGLLGFVKEDKKVKIGRTARPLPAASPKTLTACNVDEGAPYNEECKFKTIWKATEVVCNGQPFQPKKTFEKLTKMRKTITDEPWKGNKKFCEDVEKAVRAGVKELVAILEGITGITKGVDTPIDANDFEKFRHLHSRVFLTMTAGQSGEIIQTPALRKKFQTQHVGRLLRRYRAPLGAGPSALCIELGYCAPVRANAILRQVKGKVAPYVSTEGVEASPNI